MPEAPQRNLRMFGRICGSSFAKRVLFVTTMWDKVSPPRGEERERELRERYLRPMLDLGARMVRFENEFFPAWKWVCQLLTMKDDTPAALIQEEMVDWGLNINETKAARTLQVRLQEALSEQKKTIKEINRLTVEDTSDLQKLEERITRLEKELNTLRIPVMRRIQLFMFKRPKGVRIFLILAELYFK
jgi:uncharacterized coiled-coil protein SlyX